MPDRPTGLLLVNLGTPDAPEAGPVRRYLREFLSDPRVIDIPAPARWALLNLVILPFRPRTSAAAYRSIWTPQGSPLLLHGLALRDALAKSLGGDYRVELAMRYGRPPIGAALDRLAEAGVRRVQALPLFPQYAASTTGSALAKVYAEAGRRWDVPAVEALGPFYDDPGFIAAWTEVARPVLDELRPDHVLFSYHGLPERHVRRSDPSGRHCLESDQCCDAVGAANRLCYRAHCAATTRALAATLAIPPERHTMTFQSRLGRTPWLRPYTDQRLPELAAAGVRRVAVLCPAFVADCLETLEEIGIRAREQWHALGGDDLRLVPSLNTHSRWVEALADIVRRRDRKGSAD